MRWVITYKYTQEPVYWIDKCTFAELLAQIPEQFKTDSYEVCPA